MAELTEAEIMSFTVVRLRTELKAAGLPTTGKKAELRERLRSHLRATAPAATAASGSPVSAPVVATATGSAVGTPISAASAPGHAADSTPKWTTSHTLRPELLLTDYLMALAFPEPQYSMADGIHKLKWGLFCSAALRWHRLFYSLFIAALLWFRSLASVYQKIC